VVWEHVAVVPGDLQGCADAVIRLGGCGEMSGGPFEPIITLLIAPIF